MSIVFLAFEATGIGPESKPVEVAICNELGASEEFLIRPEPSWVHWDSTAEFLHGITQARIRQFGLDARYVADRVHELLTAADTVYSASPKHEYYWLEALMYVGRYPTSGLHDVRTLHWQECEPLRKRNGDIAMVALLKKARDTVLARGALRRRAGPESRFLYCEWLEVRRLVDELKGS